MRDKHPRKDCELQPVTMSLSLTAASLHIEAKAKPSSSSSQEVPGTRSAIASDNSSPDSPDSSSDDGSDTFSSNGSDSSPPNSSSPASLNMTSPESNVLKKSGLFDDSPEENQNTQPIALYDTSSRSDSDVESVILRNPAAPNDYGTVLADNSKESSDTQSSTIWDTSSRSESDAETVILCNAAANNDSAAVSADNPGPEESGAVSGGFIQGDHDVGKNGTSDSASENGSDSSSRNCSDTFSPVGPRSLSPASSTTSSQALLDTDELEPRIPRGSQAICAYTSPVQDGRRIRTSCDRNDDTGRWHVDPDGFINEARRAGGPYLFPLPVVKLKYQQEDPLNEFLEDCTLTRPITAILNEHGVYPLSMRLRKCEYKFYNEFDYLPTLIISATRDTFDDSWVKACRKVWRHLSDAGLGQVNVEISDLEIQQQFFVSPIQRTDPVWPVRMEIQDRIQAEVDITDMITLGTIRMGTCDSREEMPLTVSMDVRYDSNRDWRVLRDQIVKILDDMNLPMVGVIIMKAKTWGRGSCYKD